MKKFKSKKGEGLALNVIVVAILILIVLVILIVIFGRSITKFIGGTRDCAALGGEGCAPAVGQCSGQYDSGGEVWEYTNIPGSECADSATGPVCCKRVIKLQ